MLIIMVTKKDMMLICYYKRDLNVFFHSPSNQRLPQGVKKEKSEESLFCFSFLVLEKLSEIMIFDSITCMITTGHIPARSNVV